jgi:hypothetical protein
MTVFMHSNKSLSLTTQKRCWINGSPFASSLSCYSTFGFGTKICCSFISDWVILAWSLRPSFVRLILFTPYIKNCIVLVYAFLSRFACTEVLTLSQFFLARCFFSGDKLLALLFSSKWVCIRSRSRKRLRMRSSSDHLVWSLVFFISRLQILVMNFFLSMRIILISSFTDCWE